MRWLFRRFMYRPLMRLSHRYHWHYMRECYPAGDTMIVCDWCGARYVTHRKEWDHDEVRLAIKKIKQTQ